MRNHRTTKRIAAMAAFLVAAIPTSVAAGRSDVRGEVVEVRRAAQAGNPGELDQLTIRTRSGETRRLLLGEPGSCPASLAAGDQVRARVMAADGAKQSQRVRSMQVRRTGESFRFRNKSGEMVRTQNRLHDGSNAALGNGEQSRRQERGLDRTSGGGGAGRGHGGAGGGRR
jgi:hypothetical protein